MSKRTWIAALLGAVMAGGAGMAAPASAYQDEGGFSEGTWEGYLGMDASYTFATDDGPVPVDYRAMGAFSGVTTAGTFRGQWRINVHSEVDLGGTLAEARVLGVGNFNGPTTFVELELDALSVTEDTLGMSFTFTAEELPGASGGALTVQSSDCNSVTGIWEIFFPDNVLEGEFTALRLGDDRSAQDVASERRDNQAELTSRGSDLLNELRGGTVDVDAIRTLIEDLEGSLGALPVGECGGGSNRSFRSSSTELIDSVLFELVGSAEELDARTLIELILAGLRSGSFAENPDTRDFWMGEYERAVDAAIASGNVAVLGQFSAASRLLGRTDEANAIDSLLSDLGMGS